MMKVDRKLKRVVPLRQSSVDFWHCPPRWLAVFSLLLWLGGVQGLVGCGTMGPIVAPENVGVNAKRQKDRSEQERLEREAQLQKEQEEGRALSPGPATATDQSKEEEPTETAPDPEDRVADPGARPYGDVLVKPR